MGRSRRPRPQHLASKLLQIRTRLRLTQKRMLGLLDYQDSPLSTTNLSEFELGRREPPLPLLLRYAQVVGVTLEALVNDALSLPDPLPLQLSARRVNGGHCPYCYSTERQVKNGHNPTGSQRYYCWLCRRRYTPNPSVGGSYPDDVRLRAVELSRQGLSFRRIGRVLGVNHQSVINWVDATARESIDLQ
jgi:transposase-like protein/DNA-binding XRE family transcriptional regulator